MEQAEEKVKFKICLEISGFHSGREPKEEEEEL